MSLPRISIVTPSFNQGRYIDRTIRSVLLQGYENLEYGVMDGGSQDSTRQALAWHAGQLSFVESARDRGQSDAIARGLARTSGEIMGWLNSDDLLAPGALHAVAAFFRDHPDVDVVYSHRVVIDEHDRVLYYWVLPPHSNYLMSRWDLIPQETCFWRRGAYERAGGVDASFRFAMDYDLFARMMRTSRFARLDRFLGAFRVHPSSKTSSQMETIGQAEVKRVQEMRGIGFSRADRFWSRWFWSWVHRQGMRYAAGRMPRLGEMPAVGCDYNSVWGGRLKEPAPGGTLVGERIA
jgi:glycosyltransferase involved in cell wall biosynthesis